MRNLAGAYKDENWNCGRDMSITEMLIPPLKQISYISGLRKLICYMAKDIDSG